MTMRNPHPQRPDRRFRSRPRRNAIGAFALALASVLVGCAKPADVIETGALLVHVSVSAEAPVPDELRAWVYDDDGAIFTNERIPQRGSLVPAVAGGPDLGTFLIQPGATRGPLRLHVQGLQGGVRKVDGAAWVPPEARARGKFDLILGTDISADQDMNGVPDLIDDCRLQTDPQQRGCSEGGAPDGSSSAAADGGAWDGSDNDGRAGSGGAGGANGAEGSGGAGPGTGGARGTGGSGQTGGVVGSGGRTGAEGGGGRGVGTGGGSGGVVGTGGKIGTGGAASGGSGAIDAGIQDGAAMDTRAPDAQAQDSKAAETGTKFIGTACANSSECSSTFCVDGVCCQSACDQPCQACGFLGLCLPVTRTMDVPQCAGARTCDMKATCVAN